VRGHRRLEISVLGLEVVQHVLVVDLGIALVLEPEIGVLDADAVPLVAVGSRLGAGRFGQVGSCRHLGFLGLVFGNGGAGGGCSEQENG
jgi:hypothetical protein